MLPSIITSERSFGVPCEHSATRSCRRARTQSSYSGRHSVFSEKEMLPRLSEKYRGFRTGEKSHWLLPSLRSITMRDAEMLIARQLTLSHLSLTPEKKWPQTRIWPWPPLSCGIASSSREPGNIVRGSSITQEEIKTRCV